MASGKPAAKSGDTVTGTDVHVVLVPAPGGPVPTPTPMPFVGSIDGGLVAEVVCEGQPIAVEGSSATNQPAHVPVGGRLRVWSRSSSVTPWALRALRTRRQRPAPSSPS